MKKKSVFYCTDCGNELSKWVGQCPMCGAWNTIVEAPETKLKNVNKLTIKSSSKVELMSEIGEDEEIRFTTGINELDRVLGGGAVRGSIVLLGGAPGVGKSTLLLQLCGLVSGREKVLYISGEESRSQIKMRAKRININYSDVYLYAETDMASIINAINDIKPDIIIIDSIQTVYDSEISAAAGSISQVRDCTMNMMRLAKENNFTAFIVGHINKEGNIAGPKVLEHIVDCVLYFEGEQQLSFRILRAAKNRFGSTNEIGVFEMAETGLKEIPNPSEVMLSGRPENSSGSCVTCLMEGSRPILAEIQSLVTKSGFAAGRRTSSGLDYNRANLLIAVAEKRAGLSLINSDVYMNVVGGIRIMETSADLASLLALISSYKDIPIPNDLAALGEVGLSGEIRSVSHLNQRLSEIQRMGFKRCLIPRHIKADLKTHDGLEIIKVKNIREAIIHVF